MICLGCVLAGITAWAQSEPAQKLWQAGQEPQAGSPPERTVGYYEAKLHHDPEAAQDLLSLAATCLEKGDETSACLHLAHYLDAHPKHHIVRAQYADLLLRIGRVDMARLEFCRFLLDTENDEAFAPDWVHCHQRLAEIAEILEARYEVWLHRGIALYLMTQQLVGLMHDDEWNREGMLCRAAADLAAARVLQRDRARPCWNLHLIWSKLGQSQPAGRFLHEARRLASGNDLTPAEELSLRQCALAWTAHVH
jgi:hypothetical protein